MVFGSADRRTRDCRGVAARLTALLTLLFLPLSVAAAGVKVGDRFPPLSGRPAHHSPAVEPGRILLVDFWASWCAPCKASFPAYARLNAEYAARGLQIVAVSVDENPDAFEAFVRRMKPPFTILLDQGHQLARQVAPPALPTCFLLGPDGRVRFLHTGYHDDTTAQDLRKEIEAVLAESAPTS